MSLLLLIAGVVLFFLCAFFVLILCLAARDGDERAREAFQRERQERAARSELGYWRGGHHS